MHTLFVSDVHLDASEPAITAQFLEFLRGPARAADCLFILGDLFEYTVGDDDGEPLQREIGRELAALVAAGVPVAVMRGNRDFLYGPAFERRTGCRLLPDPVVVDLYGTPVLLSHGDLLCSADVGYQRLRSIVREPRWQQRWMRLPLASRALLGSLLRGNASRYADGKRPDIMDVEPATVDTVLETAGVATIIHGHTHRPAVHELLVDGRAARRIVLGAWHEQGSCLRWNGDGSFELQVLGRTGVEP
jgi:UDP-2,3-diacylglucosamine hydrolase